MELKLKCKEKDNIFPWSSNSCTISGSPLLYLSNNDQVMPSVYTQMLFFYPPSGQQEEEKASSSEIRDSLKASLSQALSLFYPLSGCLGDAHGKLHIELETSPGGGGGGVPFWEAFVEARLDLFGDLRSNPQPNPLFQPLMPLIDDASTDIAHAHLFLAQLTHFECGGWSLGVALHHHVCDGKSVAHFLSTWADIASGKGISIPPFHDRTVLKSRNPPTPSFPHIEYKLGSPIMPSIFPEMAATSILLTPFDIDTLRKRVFSSSHINYTGFECLAGLLWKCVTRARGLECLLEVKLGMAVDGRKRFTPLLPEGYFGNVNFYACATSIVSDLVDRPLDYAVGRVHEAIARVNDEYMRSSLDWIEEHGPPSRISPSFDSFLGSDLAMTSWTRFPLYDMDFGFGKPLFAGIPASAWDGLVIMLPAPSDPGSLCALIGLQKDHMKAMELDSELFPCNWK